MNVKNNSSCLAFVRSRCKPSNKIIYPDLKPTEKAIKYFKELVIPEEKNYNYAMTTLPYINPPRENEVDKEEPELKKYKEEKFSTVGALPPRFRTFFRYSH